MIARALGAFALVASAGFATPWTAPGNNSEHVAVAADAAPSLHDAVENAAHRHVPGAAGQTWVLDSIQRSSPDIDGSAFIVASGRIMASDGAGTQVRLSGRYRPDTGEVSRVSYRLQAASPRPVVADAAGGWTLQQAVQHAFGEVLPDQPMQFVLSSAQSSRVEGGGRRFDGAGIGTWGEGDARFVAFTLTLSARGEMVVFDYRAEGQGDGLEFLARD
ncbi:hypothetical protein [Arenimonas alkanexedens]